MDQFLKQSIIDAHLALDRLGAPTSRRVPRRDDPTQQQEITLTVAERIERLTPHVKKNAEG